MNYSNKLDRLRDRRQGLYSRNGTFDSVASVITERKQEKFTSISEPESVKYALGAMQPVDREYTENTYAEGNRVRDRLAEGLTAVSIPSAFEYQGSVPLDVHVRGNSDIDLLVIHRGFVTVDSDVQSKYAYYDVSGPTPIECLKNLRAQSIDILKRRFYAADVDTSGSKSITLSGGSLKRVIDVVPSHWHDTLDWKQSGNITHRKICILDSHTDTKVTNLPFMHINRIAEKCGRSNGALRKVIRLLKNLRYDADTEINLSSYDIASIAWHMTEAELQVPFGVDLLLVERARTHLKMIIDNELYRRVLQVPNGTRLIYNDPKVLTGTKHLYAELDQLAKDIANELDPYAALYHRVPSQILSKAVYL